MSTTIDAAWLAARTPPYILDQDNETYTLAVDVSVPASAFLICAPSITFDLGGHTIFYGNQPPVSAFASGWSGWYLPAVAKLVTNTVFLYSKQIVQITGATAKEYLSSAPILIPEAGRWYTASVIAVQATAGATVELAVIDHGTGNLLDSVMCPDPVAGRGAVLRFRPENTNPLGLEVIFTPPANGTGSVYIDVPDFRLSDDYGIVAPGAWSSDIPGWANFPDSITQGAPKPAANLIVRNGTISQGQAKGYASTPFYLVGIGGVILQNVTTKDTGADNRTIDVTGASAACVFINCNFNQGGNYITDRQMTFATLTIGAVDNTVTVSGCNIVGSPQIGIKVGGTNPAYSTTISGNMIAQNSSVTNAYGILIVGLENFTVSQNYIAPTNGRGIDLDGYSGNSSQNGTIASNIISVKEGFDREYPTFNVARALRVRNDATPPAEGFLKNITISGNLFEVSPSSTATFAFAGWVSLENPNGLMNNCGLVFDNNRFVAVTSGQSHAAALVLDGCDKGTNPVFSNNNFGSNECCLALTGYLEVTDYGNTFDSLFSSNTLEKHPGPAPAPFVAIAAGTYNRQLGNVTLHDMKGAGGANPTGIVLGGTGTKNLVIEESGS